MRRQDLPDGILALYFPQRLSQLRQKQRATSLYRWLNDQLHGYLMIQPRLGVQLSVIEGPGAMAGELSFISSLVRITNAVIVC